MAYCDSDLEKDLELTSKQRQIVPKETILEFVSQMVNVFQYLNQQKVFHRDIKPSNILIVREEGFVLPQQLWDLRNMITFKLGDFGTVISL